MGRSLSAPATGGLSVVSPQYIRYAAGSEKEKGAGGPLHGDTIAQLFLFCNGAVSGWRGGSWFGLRPPYSGKSGLACAAIPPAPPSNVLETGGPPCTPDGGCAPCTLLGAGMRGGLWRGGRLSRPLCPGTFLETGGHAVAPAGAVAPAPQRSLSLGERVGGKVERGNPAICADAYPCQRRPSAAPGLPCRSPTLQKGVSYRRRGKARRGLACTGRGTAVRGRAGCARGIPRISLPRLAWVSRETAGATPAGPTRTPLPQTGCAGSGAGAGRRRRSREMPPP